MMDFNKTSPLTAKVLAHTEVPGYDMNEAIAWALDMLALGYDTPSLLTLAGLSNHEDYFEKSRYLDKTCQELGLALKVGEAGIISYCSFFVKEIAQNRQVRNNLRKINSFSREKDYTHTDLLYEFCYLQWAWEDFDFGEEYSDYWFDATATNIEHLVIETAKVWLDRNTS